MYRTFTPVGAQGRFYALGNLEENHFPTNFINDFYTMYMKTNRNHIPENKNEMLYRFKMAAK